MKLFTRLSLLSCAVWILGATARADIPMRRIPPSSSSFTILNSSAFKEYKFSYTKEPTGTPSSLKPIKDGEQVSFADSIRLFVQGMQGAPEEWRTVRASDGRHGRGQSITITISSVRVEKGKIVVSAEAKRAGDSASEARPNRMHIASFPFTIGALGVCGMAILARQRRGRFAPEPR